MRKGSYQDMLKLYKGSYGIEMLKKAQSSAYYIYIYINYIYIAISLKPGY